MSSRIFRLCALLCLAFLVGCGGNDAHDHDHDHEHEHADHDHDHAHGHAPTAPHGGALAVLGEEFAHLEWVGAPESEDFTVYVLDGHAVGGVPIPDTELRFSIAAGGETFEVTATARANALSGEKVGNTSEFGGSSPKLAGLERFEVTLERITVRGVEFRTVSFSVPEGSPGH